MSKLRPTLWRTCRVIASETRLRLLWHIFEGEGLSVGEMGRGSGISEENASIQLRALNARGLITPHQKKNRIVYYAEANHEVEHAEELLRVLCVCCENKISFEKIIRWTTAFTHVRRIELVHLLEESNRTFVELLHVSGMSRASLFLHLNKLEARHFVVFRRGLYRLTSPKNLLGASLLKMALSSGVKRAERDLPIQKIISGGQTGADRAALDVARVCDIPHGGWCPKGRRAEDGPIADGYHLQELDSASYPKRTRANVQEADLTLIFSHGPLSGGSLLTRRVASTLKKPCVHIDLSLPAGDSELGDAIYSMTPSAFDSKGIVVNVAGPRASNDPEIYRAVYEQMLRLLF